MKYMLVSNTNPHVIEKDINKALADGYTPLGGIQVMPLPSNAQRQMALFVQSLVLMEPEDR